MKKTKIKIYIEDIREFNDMLEQSTDETIEIVDSAGNYDRSIEAYERFIEHLSDFFEFVQDKEKSR